MSVALVTGANRGLGLEPARQLGERGVKAIVGARSPANGGRIVNVSSTMGSLTDQLDPSSGYYGVFMPAYRAPPWTPEGARIVVRMALSEDGATGRFVDPDGVVLW